jgi:molybdopterin synthase sulfur carrier subunit
MSEAMIRAIRVAMPAHLRTLAGVSGDVTVEVNEIDGQVTRASILDALETQYPMLRGTIREHVSGERRPFLRFFACGEDVTHNSPDDPLPPEIVSGAEPFYVIGAIAGG